MSTWRRLSIAITIWGMIAVVAIIYYQVFEPVLAPMARGDYQGPFTPVIENVEWMAPVALLVIGVGVLIWVIAGAVQEERARQRVVR